MPFKELNRCDVFEKFGKLTALTDQLMKSLHLISEHPSTFRVEKDQVQEDLAALIQVAEVIRLMMRKPLPDSTCGKRGCCMCL